MIKRLVKVYLKSLTKEQRQLRLIFVGKRLSALQYSWLHLNSHPWRKE